MITKNQQKFSPIKIVLVLAVMCVALLVGGYIYSKNFNSKTSSPQNGYDTCVATEGSRILNTYPEQCTTSDGERYTKPY